MKLSLKALMLSLLVIAFVAGCAQKPEQEIVAAKAAVDAVTADGGERYAPQELKGINDTLTAALNEVQVQEKKWFKNYDEAKKKLAQATTDATALKTVVAERKEAAKKKANEDLAAATKAVGEAKALLAKAPTGGKDARKDVEAMKADLAGLEKSLTDISAAITSEDYFAASDKAMVVSQKSGEIKAQVEKALAKLKSAKKKAAKK